MNTARGSPIILMRFRRGRFQSRRFFFCVACCVVFVPSPLFWRKDGLGESFCVGGVRTVYIYSGIYIIYTKVLHIYIYLPGTFSCIRGPYCFSAFVFSYRVTLWEKRRGHLVNPFRTAVLFWGQTTRVVSSLAPKRDCGPK